MGEVWRASDSVTDRIVAVKVLPAQFSDDVTFRHRFRREAQAAAGLNSPHVIPIYDYGEIDGRLFVTMRLIEGRDLHSLLTDGAMSPARAVPIVEQIAKALHAAHKTGLVHRDVKPSNVLVDEDDFAYLIDFGIARSTDDTRITGTGDAVGTLSYMAPERLAGNLDDARADIYALTCVLYECLAGKPPFTNSGMASLVLAHLQNPPPRLSDIRPGLPMWFDTVIAKGMAKNPDHRYRTTAELAHAARDALSRNDGLPNVPPTVLPPTAHSINRLGVSAPAVASGPIPFLQPSPPPIRRPWWQYIAAPIGVPFLLLACVVLAGLVIGDGVLITIIVCAGLLIAVAASTIRASAARNDECARKPWWRRNVVATSALAVLLLLALIFVILTIALTERDSLDVTPVDPIWVQPG